MVQAAANADKAVSVMPGKTLCRDLRDRDYRLPVRGGM
jgi:hypothetical protein